jgi:LPS export ABC transporter protein LptC
VVAVLVAGSCADAGPTGEGYRDLPADHIMVGATHTATDNGLRAAVGVFDTVYVFADSSLYHLRGVNLRLYNTEGRETALVTSRTGVLNTVTEAMVARGGVVLITSDQRKIETEELHYDPTQHRVWSTVTTRMTYQGRVQTGDSFNADDQFTRVEVSNPRGDVPGIRIRR